MDILIVDHNQASRDAKSRLMQQAGFAVGEASRGQEALQLVAHQKPALVLLGAELPDMDVFDVCHRIKHDPDMASTMVVQLSTAFRDGQDNTRALGQEADAYLTDLLRRDGHRVDTAANGRQALAKLHQQTFDLILCDLRMPELDGPGLYRQVAQELPHLLSRFLFLTGDALSPEIDAFLKTVPVPHLAKPFSAAEGRRAVWQALQTQR